MNMTDATGLYCTRCGLRLSECECPPVPHDNHKGRYIPSEEKAEDMTLRDYFAGMILSGFMANKHRSTTFDPCDDAAYCYKVADAMMKAREESE